MLIEIGVWDRYQTKEHISDMCLTVPSILIELYRYSEA